MVEIKPGLDGAGLKIGIVRCRFNGRSARSSSRRARPARRAGVAGSDIAVVAVAGALEAPLALQRLAQTGDYDALVALGAVIRGETYHFEIVANESASRRHARSQLEFGMPIGNGILTTDTDAQAEERAAPKGCEAAPRSRSRWRASRARSTSTTGERLKSARRRAREFALQGLYQWQLVGQRRVRHPHASSPRTRISTRRTRPTSTRCARRDDRGGRDAEVARSRRSSTARSSSSRRSSARSCCSARGSSSTRPRSRTGS